MKRIPVARVARCVTLGLVLVGAATLALAAAPAAPRPNILLIVSDDHGYADVGFQGCKDIPTPHLDRLAREGVHFTNGYVTHPFCSPTRAALMTGRYQQRFGHEKNPFYNPADRREGLPVSERLLPEFLSKAGYKTGWIGKWHLGAATEFRPENRGFAETFGFIGGGHKFQDWEVNVKTEYNVPLERNGQPEEVKQHLSVVFGREAAAFVQRHKGAPWFLYLAFNAPHTPHEPTAERLARFSGIADLNRRKYAAQVSLMDDAIGETLQALRASGQDRDTLVFFFSDNGGPITVNASQNGPLRGGKGQVYEGGVRVPFVMTWPAKLPAGGSYDPAVSAVDVFATSLGVAGAAMPTDRTYDSVNLIPFVSGDRPGMPHDHLFWRTATGLSAVRAGDLKLVRQSGAPDELYDLRTDLGETTDLSGSRREDAARLATALATWDKTLVPPAFPGAPGGQKSKAKKK